MYETLSLSAMSEINTEWISFGGTRQFMSNYCFTLKGWKVVIHNNKLEAVQVITVSFIDHRVMSFDGQLCCHHFSSR